MATATGTTGVSTRSFALSYPEALASIERARSVNIEGDPDVFNNVSLETKDQVKQKHMKPIDDDYERDLSRWDQI